MPDVTLAHFYRAATEIAAHGDNDMLSFDVDTRFIADKKDDLSAICFDFYDQLQRDSVENTKNRINALTVFNERIVSPTGPVGFRSATKIQAFWNLYLNGLGVAIAEKLAGHRSAKAWSYRFLPDGEEELFDRNFSWRAFREFTADRVEEIGAQIVVQADISSFYEHVSHHHLENQIDNLFQDQGRMSKQIIGLLTKFSGGRSFGLPVGGQSARILAELALYPVDREMTVLGIDWVRYVDDYVIFAQSSEAAYSALSRLSQVLADYGLTLSKSKTSILSARHYSEYVKAQLGGGDTEASKLREIDIHYDPYSDNAIEEYDSLRETVESLEVQKLLNRELEKSLPDTFLVTQIGRTLVLHNVDVASQLIRTLLGAGNLHAFRASWSSIMRGVARLRSDDVFESIYELVDTLLDRIPQHSPHLIQAEAALLHYLRTLRFGRTDLRAAFVRRTFDVTRSETVRRACLDCWRKWGDRHVFTALRNSWNQLNPELQRLVWLATYSLGDEGEGIRRQYLGNTDLSWRIGAERKNVRAFSTVYREWCKDEHDAV